MHSRFVSSLVLATIVLLVGISRTSAEPTKEQADELREIWNTLVEAGKQYKAGQGREAAKLVEQAQARYDKFDAPADEQTQALLDRIYKSLQGAHGAMQLDGIRLPKLNRRVLAPAPKPVPDPAPDTPDPAPPTPTPDADMVSFSQHVAPMLLAKCGRCHVNDSKGQFNVGTFANLMRGSEAGRVIFTGDPDGSPLVEVIVEGDMPRGGGKVTAEELAALLSTFVYEPRSDQASPADFPTGLLAERWASVEELWQELVDLERKHRLSPTRRPDPGFARQAYRWASGEDFDDASTGAMAPGDFVRVSRQLVDLLKQVRDVAPDMRDVAQTALKGLDRGVVAAQGAG